MRYLGLSEAEAGKIRRAVAVHPIAALQSEYSLFSRDVEDNGVLTTVRELGITLVPYGGLGRGFLSATVRENDFSGDDVAQRSPRFLGDNFAKNLAIVERFGALAREFSATPAQLAIAWLLAQGDDITPLAGMKRRAHVEENVGAEKIVLTEDRLARIEEAVPKGSVSGARSADPFTAVS